MHRFLLPCLLLPLVSALPAQEKGTDRTPVSDLEHDLTELGSPALGGRIAGSEGCREAARRIAGRLEEMGFEGLGDDGGLLSTYVVQRIEYPAAPKLLFRKKDGTIEEGRYGVDFNLVVRGEAHSTGEIPIVRVTRIRELPAQASKEAALFLRGSAKDRSEWLAQRGQGDGEGWGLDLRLGASEEPGRPKEPPPTRLIDGPEDEGCEIVYLRGPMREALLWKGYTSVELVFDEERTEVREANVVAMLPGADPELAREVVLLQAGYDGVPNARGVDVDAGSSAAVLLDIARRLSSGPRPARTLVVLFATETPKVRRGLGRFLASPPFDLERLRHVICLAELSRPGREMGDPPYLWMVGVRSSLGAALAAAGLPVRVPPKKLGKGLRGAAIVFAQAGYPADRAVAPYPLTALRGRNAGAGEVDIDYLAFASRTLSECVEKVLAGEIEVPASGGTNGGGR